jgi:CRISPR-associated protein Cas2
MSRYIVAYDITDDRDRRHVVRLLEQFGERLQRSVFEVWLDPDDLPELQRRVGPLLGSHDLFEMIPIDSTLHRPRWQGGTLDPLPEPVVILGR